MISLKSIDVQIATFIKRAMNYYIKKRTLKKQSPTQDEIWDSLFKEKSSVIHQLNETTRIYLHKDSILCKLIYSEFEPTEISFVKRYLKKGDIFFDIGSNVGIFSLYASPIVGIEGEVYSFEPTPLTYQRLLENIKLNNFSNCKPQNIGLSNTKAELEFNMSTTGYDAWNSFTFLKEHIGGEKIKIAVQTLDDFIIQNKVSNISLIKLDVEGWEKFVLEGATQLLKRTDAPVFLIEFTEVNAFAAGYYLGEIFDLMVNFGYEWYSYNEKENSLVKEIKKLHYEYENLIAIKDLNLVIQRLSL